MNGSRQAAQVQQKNWWQRNWKWFVPVVAVGGLALLAAMFALIAFLVFGMMKSSAVYQGAVSRATANPVVQEELGMPIEEGLLMTGNINISGPSGDANLAIPISGPEGKATIYVEARKQAGEWNYSTLIVEFRADRNRIDLLE